MAVIKYARGEHPSGFIGYRAATTMGRDGDYRQKYFSLDQYGSEAEYLAHRQNRRWRAVAEQLKTYRRIVDPTHKNTKEGVTGITGMFMQNDYYLPRNGGAVNIRPKVVVSYLDKDGVRKMKSYGVKAQGGLRQAWLKACKFYATVYKVRPRDYTLMRKEIPSEDAVATYLAKKAREAGYNVRKDTILKRMC